MMYGFFALINRIRYIKRWSLMRSTIDENVCEHSWETAVLAHALAVIGRDIFGKQTDPDKVVSAALYHDVSEVMTGDMPTPVKYRNSELRNSYKSIERASRNSLIAMLPSELCGSYSDIFSLEENDEIRYYVKAADKLSAYLKCVEERKSGNREFDGAEKEIKQQLEALHSEELDYFLKTFGDAYDMNIDELSR